MLTRQARSGDAKSLAALSTQLGYPAEDKEAEARLLTLTDHPDHALFVAENDAGVVGWIHVCRAHRLGSPAFAEVLGLVVEESLRGQGVGSRLLTHAEAWAKKQDLPTVRIRCNARRTATHAFYRRRGYRESKTQKVFLRSS